MIQVQTAFYFVQHVMQRVALAVFATAALLLLVATIMAALGQWPWIDLSLRFGGEEIPQAGMYAQIAVTVLAAGLLFFLPTNRRVMQLENSHRSFAIGMKDVARAYHAVHAADRATVFQLSSEFDAVRERIAYLRDHPDLSTLEPQILEVAAQMSHISSELASVYSDEKIARARSFLKQRQEEIESFNARLDQAKHISTEMKQWLQEVELEESVAVAQLDRLRAEMDEIMPQLGTERVVPVERAPAREPVDSTALDNTVIEMPPKAAE